MNKFVLVSTSLPCMHTSQRNIIHGSDAVESAQREIALWFPEGVTSGPVMGKEWIYEN